MDSLEPFHEILVHPPHAGADGITDRTVLRCPSRDPFVAAADRQPLEYDGRDYVVDCKKTEGWSGVVVLMFPCEWVASAPDDLGYTRSCEMS